MAFLLKCPNCGDRSVYEFRHGGELASRPGPSSNRSEWVEYYYFRKNLAGEQREWWYHSFGCRKWFIATRNTVTNKILNTEWPDKVT